MDKSKIAEILDTLAWAAHSTAKRKGFWDDSDGGGHVGVKLLLIGTEVAEAAEEARKQTFDVEAFLKELADVMIRTMDLAKAVESQAGEKDIPGEMIGTGSTFGEILLAKMEFNETREVKHGGKRF